MNLIEYGWNENWAAAFDKLAENEQKPGRICMEQKGSYRMITQYGELYGEVSGRFRHGALGYDSYPSVGDWVIADLRFPEDRAVIQAVLPRKSTFSRKVAGALTQEQVLAANFDYVIYIDQPAGRGENHGNQRDQGGRFKRQAYNYLQESGQVTLRWHGY